MKILLVTLEYKPFNGGVAEYYSAIFDNWPSKNIFVLTGKTEKIEKESSRIIRRNLISFIFSWLSSFFWIAREIREKKIDHIVVGHILPLGTVVWLLSYVFNFKYSVILHGMDYSYSQKKARKKKLVSRILSRSTNIICANSYLKTIILKDYSELKEKISVVNPGVTAKEQGGFFKKSNKIFNLFFIGRLVKRKGVDRTIEAINLIDNNKYPNINFLIAGAGPDEDYLKNLSNDTRIKFIGKISDEEKWKYMRESDIFVMPSRDINGDFEGFGIVYLEANLMETAVIATDSGGVSDAVENNVGGILLEDDNPETIKNAIISFYENEEFKISLGEKGRQRVLDDFLWKKQVNKIHKIINK